NILKTCFEESVRPAITELLTFEDSGEKFKCKEIRGFFLDTPTYSESNICVGTIQKQLSKEEEFLIHEIESDPMLPEDPIYRITDKKLTQIYERYYKEFKLEACVAPLTAFEAYKTNFYDMINSVNNITTTYRIKMLKNQKAFFIKEEVKQENKSESQFDSFTAYAYCFPTSPAPEQGPEMHQQGKPKEVTPESNPTDSGPKIDQTLTK
ncbi:hypothetical protein HZA26_01865, partial [Candidatus Nomurabacteria bacterium]|nr:hypothetical protein [Candidatus Nomurabacteria bacterium]